MRVTSPLLLSTTSTTSTTPKFNPHQSSERSSTLNNGGTNLGRDALLNAAGALETMSQQQQQQQQQHPDKIPDSATSTATHSATKDIITTFSTSTTIIIITTTLWKLNNNITINL
ncbi:unnamed protein product [[Candida] boidinii]|uniref:Unnamed protein product n=1 Tax=Candida boidinii TaxID=5477 RepID=A0ACB5U8A9_CANBO|nr:unnamed protein product [[Candida] boidinii]